MISSRILLKCIISIVFFISSQKLNAQNNIDSALINLGTKYSQEKIYIQYDKGYYNPGETIWFKAYITSDDLHQHISKTMYAELINANGTILQRKTMPILASGAASQFNIPDTISSNQLTVRAYTEWMLNFDSNLFYVNTIPIINKKSIIEKPTPINYQIQFMPEGGDMLEGIATRIAFKAETNTGKPFEVIGDIVDSEGKQITKFKSIHNGMGFFNFTPLQYKIYNAIWKDKDNLQHVTPLPKVKDIGVVLNVNKNDQGVIYTITRSDDAQNAGYYLVVAQMNHQPVYTAKINLTEKTKVNAPIPTTNFDDGVMQITTFNANQIPIAERLVYINNQTSTFNTDVHLIEKNISKHGKNMIQLDVSDTISSNLSISITDASLNVKIDDENNIFSSFFLTNDLKGKIYNPAYYFNSNVDSVQQQLDLVMMTNGWRRFKWDEILQNKWPNIIHLPSNFITISGNVLGLTPSQYTGKELSIIFDSKALGKDFFTIPIAKDGSFKLDNFYFFDTAKLHYQINNDKDKKLTNAASFQINTGFEKSPKVNDGQFYMLTKKSLPYNSDLLKSLDNARVFKNEQMKNENVQTLDIVQVKSKQKSPEEKLNDKYTSGMFTSSNSRIFDVENDPFSNASMNVLSYLQGKVAGLQISTSGQPSISRRGSNTDVFLDETASDLDMVQNISMSDVAMIKVFDPPFFGASGGGPGGAVAVYLKKGGNSTLNSNIKGLNSQQIVGYSAIKEFYSPVYTKSNDSNADYRSTLYWQPFILMGNKNKRVQIPFFNNDNCKKIKVVVEGINQLGMPTREEKYYE